MCMHIPVLTHINTCHIQAHIHKIHIYMPKIYSCIHGYTYAYLYTINMPHNIHIYTIQISTHRHIYAWIYNTNA